MSELNLNINVYPDKETTGLAAGKAVEACIVDLQKSQDVVRMIFAAAPSQIGMLQYLRSSQLIDWQRIVAFNMDEYLGLPSHSPQLFSSFLEEALFSQVALKEKHTIHSDTDISTELERYATLLNTAPIDIVCLGIGENGHIAFNDPPVADFNDPEVIKVVELDNACRVQQVNDGCFPTLDEVPEKAITLTIPTLLRGKNLFCVVLGPNKSEAVKNTVSGPVSTACPASILTTHPHCSYFFDADASKETATSQSI